jgi:hypothetical protein
MPKQSARKQVISGLSQHVQRRHLLRFQRELDSDDDSVEDELDVAFANAFVTATSSRYLGRDAYRKSSRKEKTFADDLHTEWLTEAEFKQKYRMDRESFQKVVENIKNHPVFNNSNRKGRKQLPVESQLMVFLKYVGTEGDGASNNGQRNTFCVGYGCGTLYRSRVTEALCSLKDEFIVY